MNNPITVAANVRWAYYVATPDSRVCGSIPNVNGDFACVKFGHHGAANAARGDYARCNPSFFFCNINIPYTNVPGDQSLGMWLQEKVLELSFLRGTDLFRHVPYGNEWFYCIGNDQNLHDVGHVLESNQQNLEAALSDAIQTQRTFVNNLEQETQRPARAGFPNNDYVWLTTRDADQNNRTGRETMQLWEQQNNQQAIQAAYQARPNLRAMMGFLSWFDTLESAMQNLALRLAGIQGIQFPFRIIQPGRFDCQQLDNLLDGLQAQNMLPSLVQHLPATNIAAIAGPNPVTSADVKFLDNNVAMVFFARYLAT